MSRVLRLGKGKRATPLQIMVGGFFAITLLSSILLALPASSRSGKSIGGVDALFEAFSCISTTGLSVVDISSGLTPFGKAVLLVTIQVGGIGYIALVVIAMSAFGRRTPFFVGEIASEAMAGYESRNLRHFSVHVVVVTLVCEGVGFAALLIPFSRLMAPRSAVFGALFHSVNAFCTAGFSSIPDGLMGFADDIIVNATVCALSAFGAIGFIVIHDVIESLKGLSKGKRRPLRLHSRLALTVFASIVAAGTIVILLAGPWPEGMRWPRRLLRAFFQAISASSTDGYNTVDVAALRTPSLIFIMFQMFVGAAPGSTGGGVKVSSLAVAFLFLGYQLKRGGTAVVSLGKRELGYVLVERALGICSWFAAVIFLDTFALSITEGANFRLMPHLFEVVSAAGNTGLSMGVTGSLSPAGKLILTLTMFMGRVGPLALGTALAGKPQGVPEIRYPKEDIFIG